TSNSYLPYCSKNIHSLKLKINLILVKRILKKLLNGEENTDFFSFFSLLFYSTIHSLIPSCFVLKNKEKIVSE
ncbi:hypothetical protein RFF58_11110, partial [Streptococcus ruminantium]|nr:hypothetical protein [Streptococcus ruminantium]